MTLINIEYGSLASSDTLNKNFSYLDNKISEISESTTTLISSIMSNIATINSRLSDLAEDIKDSALTCQSGVNELKTYTNILLNKMSILPNWEMRYALVGEEKSEYTPSMNGYLYMNPVADTTGELTINGIEAPLKMLIPVKSGDKIVCTAEIESAFFLPTTEIIAG